MTEVQTFPRFMHDVYRKLASRQEHLPAGVEREIDKRLPDLYITD